MTLVKYLVLSSLFTVSVTFADRKNPGTSSVTSPKQAESQRRLEDATTQTPVQDFPRIAPGTTPREGEGGTPRVHIVPGAASKFDSSVPSKDAAGRRSEAETASAREVEELGKLSPGVIARNELATREGLYEDPAFAVLAETPGRLKDLLAKEKTKSLTPLEQVELTKLKLEIAEMIKVQAELDTRGKGSPPAEMVKTISQLNDVVAQRMADIKPAVDAGKIPQEAVDNLMRNVIDTYAGLGFHGGKKGTEQLGLNKALENLKNLQGDQLVGYIKYLDAYGSSYRKNRADGHSEETSHKMAAASRKKFVDDRAATAKVESLRNKDALNKKLCECTGACAA